MEEVFLLKGHFAYKENIDVISIYLGTFSSRRRAEVEGQMWLDNMIGENIRDLALATYSVTGLEVDGRRTDAWMESVTDNIININRTATI